MSAREQLKRLAFALGAGPRLQQMKRAFEPAGISNARAEHEHLRAILGVILGPDSNCVDVGASEGEVLADIVRIAPQGRHIAYEPIAQLAARLADRFPDVDVRARALSDRGGNAEFVHVLSRPGWSGFRMRPYPGAERVSHIRVPTERLDDALPPGYIPHFIKIDVEGAEEQVLRGATATISRHRPLIAFEHAAGGADHYGTRPEAIHALLTDECGLAIFDLAGQGPYTRRDFGRAFDQGTRANFLARPYELRDPGPIG
jgi:FkbM family methyltransferase